MRYATPPHAPPRRRPYRLEVHFSEQEAEALRRRAATHAGGCLAEYVRAAALGRKLDPPPSVLNLAAYQELARVGGNLNQLARHLNQGHIHAGARVAALEQRLGELGRAVAEARRLLVGVPGQ